jgi:mRNA interferase MazF
MVRQGEIIKVDLSPTVGHEQSGYRPVLVVSNDYVMSQTNMVYIAPITNTIRRFPLHVMLDERTETKGEILCEQVKAVDLNIRNFTLVERVPDDILSKVLDRIIGCFDI